MYQYNIYIRLKIIHLLEISEKIFLKLEPLRRYQSFLHVRIHSN